MGPTYARKDAADFLVFLKCSYLLMESPTAVRRICNGNPRFLKKPLKNPVSMPYTLPTLFNKLASLEATIAQHSGSASQRMTGVECSVELLAHLKTKRDYFKLKLPFCHRICSVQCFSHVPGVGRPSAKKQLSCLRVSRMVRS